jgi:hypothetical protein
MPVTRHISMEQNVETTRHERNIIYNTHLINKSCVKLVSVYAHSQAYLKGCKGGKCPSTTSLLKMSFRATELKRGKIK